VANGFASESLGEFQLRMFIIGGATGIEVLHPNTICSLPEGQWGIETAGRHGQFSRQTVALQTSLGTMGLADNWCVAVLDQCA